MDEWFLNLELEGARVQGVLRVPADQIESFQKSPLVLKSGGEPLHLSTQISGEDEDGRSKVALSASSQQAIQELRVEVPDGLLDEDQSVVGFLTLGEEEPITLLVGPGEEVRFSLPEAASSGFSFRLETGLLLLVLIVLPVLVAVKRSAKRA